MRDLKDVNNHREMVSYINNIPDDQLVVLIPTNQKCFIKQIKLFAIKQLSTRLINQKNNPEVFEVMYIEL